MSYNLHFCVYKLGLFGTLMIGVLFLIELERKKNDSIFKSTIGHDGIDRSNFWSDFLS